jgi:hypothetical protein
MKINLEKLEALEDHCKNKNYPVSISTINQMINLVLSYNDTLSLHNVKIAYETLKSYKILVEEAETKEPQHLNS